MGIENGFYYIRITIYRGEAARAKTGGDLLFKTKFVIIGFHKINSAKRLEKCGLYLNLHVLCFLQSVSSPFWVKHYKPLFHTACRIEAYFIRYPAILRIIFLSIEN